MLLNKQLRLIGMIILLGAIIGGWLLYYTYKHPYPITFKDVSSIHLRTGFSYREATAQEKKNIIDWYNSMRSFKGNKSLAGTTPNAGITITLDTGKTITITDLGQEGRNLEFQAPGMKYPYFASQNDLSNFIETMDQQLSGKTVVEISVRKAGQTEPFRKFTDRTSMVEMTGALKKAEAINTLPSHENKTEYLLTFGFSDNTGKLIDIWLGNPGEKSDVMDVTEKGDNYILPGDSTDVFRKWIGLKY